MLHKPEAGFSITVIGGMGNSSLSIHCFLLYSTGKIPRKLPGKKARRFGTFQSGGLFLIYIGDAGRKLKPSSRPG